MVKPLQHPVILNIIEERINLTNIIKVVIYSQGKSLQILCAGEKPKFENARHHQEVE